jgi:DNA invertase Pin-like site-specific DNA recombinase
MRSANHRKQPQSRVQKRPDALLLQRQPESARRFGYARVSRDDQNLAMQIAALIDAGIPEEDMFIEKISAVSAKRPQFDLMMKMLEPGDTVIVYAFNRFSRNLKLTLSVVDDFKAAGIGLQSTSEPHINPFTTHGRMMISVTGAVDEHELNRLADRTRDGMAELKRQGMWLGRKPVVSPDDARKMLAMRKRGLTGEEIAARFSHLKIKASTVYARTNELKRAKAKR